MTAVLALIHMLGAQDVLTSKVSANVAKPLFDAMQIMIPAAVAIAGLHKVMEHRESGGAFLVEMITKGGGAFLLIQLVKALFFPGG